MTIAPGQADQGEAREVITFRGGGDVAATLACTGSAVGGSRLPG
jgi:hypothetical protein